MTTQLSAATTANIEIDKTSLFEIETNDLNIVHDNIYTITAQDLVRTIESYKRFPLPDDVLFPWLHGVDGLSNQQNIFFGVRRCLAPHYRGLLLVHADDREFTSRLAESFLPTQILNVETSEFLNNYTADLSINLRNFERQVSRFATVCDIVVYGPNAEKVAEMVSKAQERIRQERQAQIESVRKSAGKRAVLKANNLKYKTIIMNDEFSVFEQNFPNSVMYDSTGLCVRSHSFWDLEDVQIKEMSKASEVTKNVWIGNTQDTPVSTHDIGSPSSSLSDFSFEDNNPHGFSICIEAHDLADMPLPSTLMLARETLKDLEDGQLPSDIIHFDVYAAGVHYEMSEFHAFYSSLLKLMAFMKEQVDMNRRVLIHCTDGYTESSLLGLSWVMYSLKLSLPDAYLYLQKQRSFFVYVADLPTLRKIEQLLFDDGYQALEPIPKQKKSEKYAECIQNLDIGKSEKDTCDAEDEEDLDIAVAPPSLANNNLRNDNRTLHKDSYLNIVSNNTSAIPQEGHNDTLATNNIYRQIHLEPTQEEERAYPWFYSNRFEGSFPSRILPFLYLGNLNHATNPEMLKALGITHIVSVGENVDLDKKDFELLFLDNLYDDGVDSIRARLGTVTDFIEDARSKDTICLVHCRVGVSRSAAVAISYVMKHLHMPLVEAYLYVRARRLNIIIQPNLKFMYEMLQLEQRETGTVELTWPTLCEEISNLNLYRDRDAGP